MATSTQSQMDSLFGYTAEGAKQEAKRLATNFEESAVEEYVHPLASVPFFDRPMSASTRDPQIGTDDMGNPVFRTKLGDTYTVRLDPDQRNLRAKIQEDFINQAFENNQNLEQAVIIIFHFYLFQISLKTTKYISQFIYKLSQDHQYAKSKDSNQ